MRVLVDSFEAWYASQFHYQKVGGPPPGEKWRSTTRSVKEAAALLGIGESSMYELMRKIPLETVVVDHHIRIWNDSFDAWYASQSAPPSCGKPRSEFLTPHTIKNVHKILRNAFNQAVKWELMSRNPVAHATLPKCAETPREIWDAETLFRAIELCDDDLLRLALHLAFTCSLRMGEMLGLTWNCIDISEESIEENRAYVFVNKELQRVTREALEQLDEKDVLFRFPAILPRRHTVLVLKEPKTKTSIRKVFLPRDVAEMLVERKKNIEEIQELLGDEYQDYGLVFCSTAGTPIEGAVINRAFSKLIQDNKLPKVVFHSLRHTSTTYKLKLSGGDIKAVQGDTGHAQATMVTERYSHILDEDRRRNAERLQEAFYSGAKDKTAAKEDPLQNLDAAGKQALLIKLLAESPEMKALLQTITQTN